MVNNKLYKVQLCDYINIHPSDSRGLLDDCFYYSLHVFFFGGLQWKKL